MRVQRLIVPGTGDPSFTVVGSDGLPIGPIESFLSLLSSLERSPNTVRAYAHDLKLFFEFLNEVAVEWSDVELDDVVNFVAWLRNANGDNVVALRPVRARGPSTINRALVTVERFYDYQGRAGRSHALGSALRDGGKRVAKQGFLAHVARDGRRATEQLPSTAPAADASKDARTGAGVCTSSRVHKPSRSAVAGSLV